MKLKASDGSSAGEGPRSKLELETEIPKIKHAMRRTSQKPVVASSNTETGQSTMLCGTVELEYGSHCSHVDGQNTIETGCQNKSADGLSSIMLYPHGVFSGRVGSRNMPLT
jgi:hypothetical protein